MLENFRSKFTIIQIRVIYNDHLAICSNVLTSYLDWTLAVTQSWWIILYELATEKGIDILNGIVIDNASIESIAFD